jgi:vacuolar protein sorting-associated protein VTA1
MYLTYTQVDGKIKYAKWKAADIAKAYREGRKPIAGPAGSQVDLEPLPTIFSTPELPLETESFRSSPPAIGQSDSSPRTSPKRQTRSPRMSPDDIARANRLHSSRHDDDTLSPGRWSTTATPGLDCARDSSSVSLDQASNWHETPLDGRGSSKLRRAWVSTDMEGATSDQEPVQDPVLNGTSPSHVPFSSSVGEPSQYVSSSPPKEQRVTYMPTHVSPVLPFLPSSSPPRHSPPQGRARGPSISSQGRTELPPGFVPSSPVPPSPPMIPVISSPPTTNIFVPHSPPRVVASPPAPVLFAAPDFELTPSIIAKAQKHCRFAISSLDYEDAEQARKELRAALALLGG